MTAATEIEARRNEARREALEYDIAREREEGSLPAMFRRIQDYRARIEDVRRDLRADEKRRVRVKWAAVEIMRYELETMKATFAECYEAVTAINLVFEEQFRVRSDK